MSRKFTAKLLGGKLILENVSGKNLFVREVLVKYKVTVVTPQGDVGVRTVTDEVKVEGELKKDGKIELPLTTSDVVEVSVIFKDGDITLREDISL
ncbi:MAG: hypothetical protein K1T65_01245 [Candidatus Aramenus sp.]|nr:hypothetical protein [Candidatus Aramenus sp.]